MKSTMINVRKFFRKCLFPTVCPEKYSMSRGNLYFYLTEVEIMLVVCTIKTLPDSEKEGIGFFSDTLGGVLIAIKQRKKNSARASETKL